MARLDIADDEIDVFDAGLDELLNGIINEWTVADWQHGFLDNFGDWESPGAPSGDRNDSFCDHIDSFVFML